MKAVLEQLKSQKYMEINVDRISTNLQSHPHFSESSWYGRIHS